MRLRLLSCLALCLLVISPAQADIVVVARSENGFGALNKSEVVNIFLGRYRQLAGGQIAEPVDLPMQSAERNIFYERLLGKTPAEINAYWARLLFTGRVSPPRQVDSSEQLIEILLNSPRTIGYLDRNKVDRRLQIVFELGSK